MSEGFKRVEFILAIVVAILLVGSLLSQRYLDLPYQIVSFLILAFVIVKVVDIIRAGGTIFEDYVSLAIIGVFGFVHFLLGERINSVIIVVIVFVLVYSIGLVPWVNDMIKSRKIMLFILSYAFFVVMIVFLFAGMYYVNSEDFTYMGDVKEATFEDSLYFSAISFSTVGYGEISPLGVNRLIASIQAIAGMILNVAFLGYVFGSKRFRR